VLATLKTLNTSLPSPAQQDGDTVTLDAESRVMDIVGVSEAELAARRAAWVAPPLKATSGTLYKYIKNVESASQGCVTDS
jgi:dihydroxy-acid dehydratase